MRAWPLAAGSWQLCLLLLALLPTPAPAQQSGAASPAEQAYRAGRYPEAIRLAETAVAGGAGVEARRTLVRALAEVGRYAEAEAAARAAGDDPELATPLGEVLRATGDLDGAEAAFARAVQGGARDALQAELSLALLRLHRGEREEGMRRLDRFIDVYNAGEARSAGDLAAVGSAVRELGARDPQLLRDALKAYDEAIAADPGDPEPRLLLGELFLDKYNSPDAQQALGELLAANPGHPRALLAMARAREFDGEAGEALTLARRALEVNPNLVPARVMLARLQLSGEDARGAEAEVRRALQVNPHAPDALALLAAIRWLQGDRAGFEEIRDRVLRASPLHARFFTIVAEAAANGRRYADAAELAREAVRLDPGSWEGHGILGLNLLRLGRVEEARQSLERSFAGDPYNAWIKNTLDLLDTFEQYQVRRTPRFELVLHGDEADLLFPFAAALAEEAYDRLAERYGYRPQTPVRIEFFPRHADFSVRTVGLVGLGALGVAFGNVLAMDSPRAREPGEMNWGSTLWHELAHTFALGLSEHRVPRWLTEGISVLEERRARPGWGSETTPEFMAAYAGDQLPPVSRLNEGFLRPRSPQHLGLAYHLASLVAEWIEETRGVDALARMLREYGQGRDTPQVLRSVLGAEPDAVDRQFDAWLRGRFPPERAAEAASQLAQGERLLQAGELDAARRSLERAVELAPSQRGGSPHALLAELHLRRGDQRAAADALTRATALDENAYEENLKLAELLEAQGDAAGATAALRRAVYIHPYDVELHRRLAESAARADDHPAAVQGRRAVVALRPVDRAAALYQLALALLRAGDRAAARAEVLRALEAAPGYAEAQELLLELR